MSLLNFNGSEPKRSGEKKSLAILVGIGALVGVIALGSTLAASINLNGGSPVEFGQGVAQTTACDDEVTVTPFSTFANDEENADFLFTSFSVTGIDAACNGKTFTLKAYNDGDNSPLNLYITGGMDTYNEINVVGDNGNYSFVDGGLLADDIEDVSTGFKVTMVTAGPPPSVALASAQDVDRITIESSGEGATPAVAELADCVAGTEYVIGEEICGGYVFLTPNSLGNSTGKYFVVLKGSTWNNYLDSPGGSHRGAWCEDGTYHDISGTGIGDGKANTIAWLEIMNSCPDHPQLSMIRNYRNKTGINWFIPSKDEMLKVYENLSSVNQMEWNIRGPWWWTSSEIDSNEMWMLGVWGGIATDKKYNSSRIIPVLSFTPSIT